MLLYTEEGLTKNAVIEVNKPLSVEIGQSINIV